jgi:predicted DNA-binding transcriptional regulator AlpA
MMRAVPIALAILQPMRPMPSTAASLGDVDERFFEVLVQITAKPQDDFPPQGMTISTCESPRARKAGAAEKRAANPGLREPRLTEHKVNYRDRKPSIRNGGAQRADVGRVASSPLLGGAPRLPMSEFNKRYASTVTRTIGPATQPRRSIDEALDSLQLLTVTDVCKLLRISKPTLWRIRRSGDFPDPTTVTERIFGWRRSEIDGWLASRPNSRRY